MLTIGAVARSAGLRASAIRYYERLGLLPPPSRVSGRRTYSDEVLPRLAVISFARASGFTLREISKLLASGKPYSKRLRETAKQKLIEIDAMIVRAQAMRSLLEGALRCNCVNLEQCGRLLATVAVDARAGQRTRARLARRAPRR